MNFILVVFGVGFALVILATLSLYVAGRSQPERHTSQISVLLPAARHDAWIVITDYARMAEWWPAVKKVRLETRPNGEVWTWNLDSQGQEIAFRTKEENAPSLLVREIVGDNLPFGGTWTFDLVEEGDHTRLTLTEDGVIRPPLFRAIARYFIGLDRTMKNFATSLEKRLTAQAR